MQEREAKLEQVKSKIGEQLKAKVESKLNQETKA